MKLGDLAVLPKGVQVTSRNKCKELNGCKESDCGIVPKKGVMTLEGRLQQDINL